MQGAAAEGLHGLAGPRQGCIISCVIFGYLKQQLLHFRYLKTRSFIQNMLRVLGIHCDICQDIYQDISKDLKYLQISYKIS